MKNEVPSRALSTRSEGSRQIGARDLYRFSQQNDAGDCPLTTVEGETEIIACPPRRDKEGDTWVEFEKCRTCTCSYGEAVCTRCIPATEDRDVFFYKELVSRHCYLETVAEVVDHAPDACCAERQVCQYISPDFLDYSYHEYGRRVNYMLIYNHGDYDLADMFY